MQSDLCKSLSLRQAIADLMTDNHLGRGVLPNELVGTNLGIRQLLVDVSDLVRGDRGTGIQRVAKAILGEWLSYPPQGFCVEPVFLAPEESRYRYARRIRKNFVLDEPNALNEDLVEFKSSDILLSLDLLCLNHDLISDRTRQYFQSLRAKGVNVRFVVHDLLPVTMPEYFPKGDHYDFFVKWLRIVAESSGAICVSKSVSNDLRLWLKKAELLSAELKINFFHHGSDIESTVYSFGLPEDFVDALSLIRLRPSFLVVGTIEPRKGHRQMLDSFEWLWNQGVDINLVFVGQKGWMVDTLAERISRHHELGIRLFWLQGISDEFLIKVYQHGTCLVASSQGEGFGLPTIEAAQAGLPIIARDISVNREICGEFASYFSSDTPIDLGIFIRNWLQDWRKGRVPDSSKIKSLTWRESASELFRACDP
jgi:glycosyltransferase involved in cell wall biosynthesis